MFEAYKVGVTLSVANKASAALGAIAADFAKTDRSAKALVGTIAKLNAAQLGLAGALVGGAGFLGLKLIQGAVKPAEEYAHQLNIMNMAGMKQVEIADSIRAAWENTSKVMNTTPTGNLKAILDLRNITGNVEEAQRLLPIVTKVQAVMAASSEGRISKNADDIAFSMAKALDIIGAVSDSAKLTKQAEMMAKVVTATQNRVTPQQFQSVFQYARQAKFDLSDEFKYEILPSLMLEYATKGGAGGGSRGVGPALSAAYRITNQGYINKKSLAEWESLGLVTPGTALKTTTEGTTVGPMKDAALAASNFFQWVNSDLVPSIRGKYGNNASDEFIRAKINELMRGNQLAASLAVEFFTKQTNFLRDQKIIRGALGYEDAYSLAQKNDPETAFKQLSAQWETLKTSIGITVIPLILPALHGLTTAFNLLGTTLQNHPWMTTALTWTFTALSGLALAGGSLMVAASALKLIAPVLVSLTGLPLATAATGLGLLVGSLSSLVALMVALDHASDIGKSVNGTWADKYNPFSAAERGGEALGHWLKGDKQGADGSWAPPAAANKSSQGVGAVYLDGHKVGSFLSQHQADAGSRPPTSGSGFDTRQFPAWAGVGF